MTAQAHIIQTDIHKPHKSTLCCVSLLGCLLPLTDIQSPLLPSFTNISSNLLCLDRKVKEGGPILNYNSSSVAMKFPQQDNYHQILNPAI